jgi:HTH-type transcriptional regulator/antitoxin HigA
MMLQQVMDRWKALDEVAHPYLVPIETESQYLAAMELMDLLWDQVSSEADSPLDSLLTLLSERIAAYESSHFPIPQSPPHLVLAFLIEQRGLTQKQLEAATGIHQGNLSQILRGNRRLTASQISSLARYFGVNPGVFH